MYICVCVCVYTTSARVRVCVCVCVTGTAILTYDNAPHNIYDWLATFHIFPSDDCTQHMKPISNGHNYNSFYVSYLRCYKRIELF